MEGARIRGGGQGLGRVTSLRRTCVFTLQCCYFLAAVQKKRRKLCSVGGMVTIELTAVAVILVLWKCLLLIELTLTPTN